MNSRTIVLYEDAAARALEPFALTRPVCEFRTGAVLLPTTATLRFAPAADYFGTPGDLTVRLADACATLRRMRGQG